MKKAKNLTLLELRSEYNAIVEITKAMDFISTRDKKRLEDDQAS